MACRDTRSLDLGRKVMTVDLLPALYLLKKAFEPNLDVAMALLSVKPELMAMSFASLTLTVWHPIYSTGLRIIVCVI